MKPLLLLLPLLALAPAADAAPPERYVSFALGTAQNARSTVRVQGPSTDAAFHGVDWAVHPFESAPYYVVKLGQWSSRAPRWGLELDFTHSKAIALTDQTVRADGVWNGTPLPPRLPLNEHLGKIRFTNGTNILSALPVHRFADPGARIQPYVGVGPAYFIIWSVSEADGVRRHARYHGSGFGWAGEVGVRGRIDERFSWYVEAKVTDGPAEVPAGNDLRLSTRIRTLHQAAGLMLRF